MASKTKGFDWSEGLVALSGAQRVRIEDYSKLLRKLHALACFTTEDKLRIAVKREAERVFSIPDHDNRRVSVRAAEAVTSAVTRYTAAIDSHYKDGLLSPGRKVPALKAERIINLDPSQVELETVAWAVASLLLAEVAEELERGKVYCDGCRELKPQEATVLRPAGIRCRECAGPVEQPKPAAPQS